MVLCRSSASRRYRGIPDDIGKQELSLLRVVTHLNLFRAVSRSFSTYTCVGVCVCRCVCVYDVLVKNRAVSSCLESRDFIEH